MNEMNVQIEVNCRGMNCPIPITSLKKALEKINSGEIVKMISTFPEASDHMIIWARRTGHELLKTEESNGDYVFFVKKK